MSRIQLIDQTVQTLAALPDERVQAVLDFASFMLKKAEEEQLQNGIQQLMATSGSFTFLTDEDDLYTIADLKERFR
jgi:hypothetical protein